MKKNSTPANRGVPAYGSAENPNSRINGRQSSNNMGGNAGNNQQFQNTVKYHDNRTRDNCVNGGQSSRSYQPHTINRNTTSISNNLSQAITRDSSGRYVDNNATINNVYHFKSGMSTLQHSKYNSTNRAITDRSSENYGARNSTRDIKLPYSDISKNSSSKYSKSTSKKTPEK